MDTASSRHLWSESDLRRKRKLGIAGICVWTILLGVAISWSYFKKPSRSTFINKKN